VLPCVMAEDGMGGRRLARSFSRSTATERLVHGEFVNYAAIGIWNSPWQWCRHA
jgi:hypothetical protein